MIEHFNDIWDESFFRTEDFTSSDHLRAENTAFIEFHNTAHRYSARAGATPTQTWANRLRSTMPAAYRPPQRLPAKGRIEVIRSIRSRTGASGVGFIGGMIV